MSLSRATVSAFLSISLGFALFQGCSAASDDPGNSRAGTKGTTTTGTGSGTGGSTGTGGSGNGSGTGTGGSITGGGINPGNPDASGDGRVNDDAACLSEPVTGEKRIVDLYMMMDNSGSMDMIDAPLTVSRWQSLADAIPSFVNDPQNAGMMLGLDFFPEGGQLGGVGASCNIPDYTMPNVPIDIIPGMGNAQSNALISAVTGRARSGGTPTTPALTGALQVAKNWQMAHPSRDLSVLFLTDGQPTGCTGNSVQTAAAAAQAAFSGTPPIKTYVLGVGPDTGNLDSIAAAGGTKMAYMATSGGAAALTAALQAIRKSTLSCDYNIPKTEAGIIDFTKINVRTRVGTTGTVEEPGQVANAASCGTGPGWFFDIPLPGTPTKITLCPGSCGPLQTTNGSELQVLLGCKTKPAPPPM